MEYLLNNVPQETAFIDYGAKSMTRNEQNRIDPHFGAASQLHDRRPSAPAFGRFTCSFSESRTAIVDAIVRLEIARGSTAYDPSEDIEGMLPDLISSDEDELY